MLRKAVVWVCVMLAVLVPCHGLGEEAETILVDAITDPGAMEGFSFAEGAELLEIAFPQILDCDAALLRCGGETMLIDCASAGQASRVTAMLEQLGVERIDYLVNTHPHYDHLEGFAAVADAVEVAGLYISFPEDFTEQMKKAVQAAQTREIPVLHYGDGDRFTLGEAVLDVWMKCPEECNLNERSAQIRVQLGERTMLFTADMQSKTQLALLEQVDPALLDVDLMKYPHHGKEALRPEFLEAASPAFAVVTNNGGKSSYYGRKCLAYAQIPYANTVPGYVYCVTDGQTWLVQRLAMDHPVTTTSRPDTRPLP
ncbi:MAG: ComEC/Rec2 family competence protein [Aristaeellaceae bacterium]